MEDINVTQLVALIVAGGQVALDLFLKMSELMKLGPDVQQNILNLVKQSDAVDDDTIARADQWLKDHPEQ